MYKPLSDQILLERGYCCGNKCLNCPYIPMYKKGNRVKKPKTKSKLKNKFY